jgi:hypothetical protein
MYHEFEIIEETEEIDIDSIEELNEKTVWNSVEQRIVKQQNKIIKAVKQINNKLKEPNFKVGGTE